MNRLEYLRPLFNDVLARIEEERGYPCELTFEDLCADVDAKRPAAMLFLERLHMEGRTYNLLH